MIRHYSGFACIAVVALLLGAAPASAAILNYTATLDGGQEVPASGSTATGSGTFTIDTVANTVSYNISFSGLSAAQSAAHIHGFAAAGVNAGVQHGLGVGSPQIGVWNYAEADEANILAGLTYVNVHTTAFPGGEIRGQIIEEAVPVEPTSWGRIKQLLP